MNNIYTEEERIDFINDYFLEYEYSFMRNFEVFISDRKNYFILNERSKFNDVKYFNMLVDLNNNKKDWNFLDIFRFYNKLVYWNSTYFGYYHSGMYQQSIYYGINKYK